MAAALTPRVQMLVVCDGIRASKTEDSVFNLRGVRCHIVAGSFPTHHSLRLFLILSSPRPGRFPGYVRVNNQTDKAVFYGEFAPAPLFHEDELLPLDVPMHLHFPHAGRYTVEIWFFQETTADILKMEQTFYVLDPAE